MKNLSGTLPKALVVIEYIAEQRQSISFQQIKRHSGFSSNVLSRILKTYIEWEYVSKDESSGLYGIGSSLLQLSKEINESKSIKEKAKQTVELLAQLTDESAAYFHFDGEWIELIAKKEIAHSYHYLQLKSREIHLPNNAFFFCILPYLKMADALTILQKDTDQYNYNTDQLAKDFQQIRKDGYLVRKESFKRTQVTRICIPIFKHKVIFGSLGISINTHDIKNSDLDNLLQKCLKLSKNLLGLIK